MNPIPDIFDHQARILIVDDERQNRQLLEIMLAPEGFVLLTAASGDEALTMVARQPPDLILLDIMMPRMDGYQVVARIKGDLATKNIPVIMVTALDDHDARMLVLGAGAEDFLTKPVDRAELCMRVRNLLRLKAYGDYHDKYRQAHDSEVRSRTAALVENERLQRTATDAAAAAPRSTSELLANVSHEIRTPLKGVIAMADRLLEIELTPEQREYLQIVKSSAADLLIVINDFVDVSRLERGTLAHDPIDTVPGKA
jgi:DNA-binding response OmpR family regulator